MSSTSLAVPTTTALAVEPYGVPTVVSQMVAIHDLMAKAMEPGEDYGTIPGCGKKPTLLKPGAEKLSLLFKLSSSLEVKEKDLPNNHREIGVKCTLSSRLTGEFVGEGIGCCSTMESKYRWRGGARLCPECGKPAIKKSKFPPRSRPNDEPGFYCFAKIGGCGVEFSADDPAIIGQSEERQENPDIADTYNTVLKIAKKRAFVDAILTATAASAAFTQDLEDQDHPSHTPAERPAPQQAPPPAKTANGGRPEPMGEAKARELEALASERDWKFAEAVAFLKTKYKVLHLHDVPLSSYAELKAKLLKAPFKPQAEGDAFEGGPEPARDEAVTA